MALTSGAWSLGTKRGKWISLAVLGGVALTSAGAAVPSTASASAETLHTWLAVQPPYLCRIWVAGRSFTRHCTMRWFRDGSGNLVSADPSWVPMYPATATPDLAVLGLTWPSDQAGAIEAVTTHAPSPYTAHIIAAPVLTSWSAPISGGSSGPFGLWTPPPGYPAYAMSDYPGDPYRSVFGYCTWYAQYRRQDERLMVLGNAAQWAWNAGAHGLRTGSVPAVGATVVFQPGVLGASSLGHVGHVEVVYSGGWFLISEMNMYWNGGGFGRVSFRYIHAMPGVSFIY